MWSASGSGMIYSHVLPTMQPYSAFHCDAAGTPAIGIFPNPYGLIALTHDAVRFFSKGGMVQATVRDEGLAAAACGCLIPTATSMRLAVVSELDPSQPSLSMLDLNTAAVATTLPIDGPATLMHYEPQTSLLCLSGADGTISTYDVRAGARTAGRCALFPSKANVICALDVAGNTLCASALRTQLGPLGTNEYGAAEANHAAARAPPPLRPRSSPRADARRCHADATPMPAQPMPRRCGGRALHSLACVLRRSLRYNAAHSRPARSAPVVRDLLWRRCHGAQVVLWRRQPAGPCCVGLGPLAAARRAWRHDSSIRRAVVDGGARRAALLPRCERAPQHLGGSMVGVVKSGAVKAVCARASPLSPRALECGCLLVPARAPRPHSPLTDTPFVRRTATHQVSVTSQLVCAGGSAGSLSVCAAEGIDVEQLQSNPYPNQPEMPDVLEAIPFLPFDAPVGHVPVPAAAAASGSLSSSWPPKLLGKRGARTMSPEAHLRTLPLPPHQQVAFGSVSATYFRNTVNRPSNLRLPPLEHPAAPSAAAGGRDDGDDELSERKLPSQFAKLRRVVVQLGKFGLAEEFSFAEHNATDQLSALDNTVPNCYCNAMLLILYSIPWLRAHCLSSLMRSQFVLSDELGFLFHMMDRSRGAACQPRNFQRALHQSREATALKLVDAVDLEGNVQGAEGLPAIICKFCAFLLEQLSKEAREAGKEAARDAAARAEAARVEAAKRERDVLLGAVSSSMGAGDKADVASQKYKSGRLTLDAIVARAYAERLAGGPATEAGPQRAAASQDAAGVNVEGNRTVFDELFGATWLETSTFPGTSAKPVSREVHSMVLRLTLPESLTPRSPNAAASNAPAGAEAGTESAAASSAALLEPGSFVEALSHCVCKESSTRAWCAEQSKYRHAKVAKQLTEAPRMLCLLTDSLDSSTMQAWEEAHDGEPWLPPCFSLSMPVRTEAHPSAARDETTEQPPIGKPRVHLDADDKPGGCAVGQRSERYHLRALVSFTQSLLPHATDGSGHLVLHFRVPTQPCEKASGGDVVSEAARLLVKAAIDNVLKVVKEGLPVSKVEVGDGATSAPATAAASAGRLVPCFRPEDVVKHWDDPGQWFVWNDFALQPSTDAEVRKAHSEWKRPCLVVYSVDGLAERVEHLAHTVTPSAGKAAYLSQEFSLMHQPPVPLEGYAPTFTALSPGESTLQRGALVAIDAEFVAVTREVTRVGARGKTIVVKPARLALARVSCLRGDGPMAGVPFIDSYVQQVRFPVAVSCRRSHTATCMHRPSHMQPHAVGRRPGSMVNICSVQAPACLPRVLFAAVRQR